MNVIRRVVSGLRRRGLSGMLARLCSAAEECLFDWRYGTDTGGIVSPDDSTIPIEHLAGAFRYEGTRLRPFRQVMALLKPSSDSVFVDFGCGKGRVLLAAARFGFKRVEGVEVATNLCRIAARNIALYKARTGLQTEFRIVELDAAQYEIQDDADYFYFFNPFGEDVMRSTLRNIVRSLDRRWREVTLIYCNPLLRQCIEETGVFRVLGEFVFNEFAVFTNRQTLPREALI